VSHEYAAPIISQQGEVRMNEIILHFKQQQQQQRLLQVYKQRFSSSEMFAYF